MKQLIILTLLILSTIAGYSQQPSVGHFRYDSTKFYNTKSGGSNELIIENSTKDSVGGVLYNYYRGRTRWVIPRAVAGGIVFGNDTVLVSGSGSGSQNLQQTTDIGNQTTDTIIATGVRTQRILQDTLDEDDFSIIVIPDTQREAWAWQPQGRSIFQWIADNEVAENIKAAISTGDMTETNGSVAQMDTVSEWYEILDDAGIPNLFLLGNHDYDALPGLRQTTVYNTFFGPSRTATLPWFGASQKPTTNDNYFINFSAGGKNYTVIGLEFFPHDSILTWANNVADSLSDREIIVATHGYLTIYNERSRDTSRYGPASPSYAADNSGQSMWDKFIKLHKNIRFVIGGHFILPTSDSLPSVAHFTDVGVHGNTVHQILVNYQKDSSGGNGFFMKMNFHPDDGTVDMSFYSAWEGRFDDRVAAYTLDYSALQVENTVGVKGKLTVAGIARMDSLFYITKLRKWNIPYIEEAGHIKDSSFLRIDSVGNHYSTSYTSTVNPNATDSNFKSAPTRWVKENFIHNQSSYIQQANFRVNGQFFWTQNNTIHTNYQSNLTAPYNFVMTAGNYGLALTKAGADAGGFNQVFYHTYNSDASVRTALPNGTNILRLISMAPQSTGANDQIGADLRTLSDSTDATMVNHRWQFRTTNPGTTTLTSRMEILGDGRIGIGTSTPTSSAVLDVTSTTKGVIFPRVTGAQMNAISSPATGLTVFNTDSVAYCFYNGSAWRMFGTGASAGGTVTSVTSGVGLTGTPNPITSTGTIDVDTLLISTRAWRQKGIDSVVALIGSGGGGIDTVSKTLVIQAPSSTENLYFFYTDRAITILKAVYAFRGASPSLTFDIHFDSDRSAGSPTELFGTNIVGTSTSGATVTSFNDATIPAGSFVWFVSSAQSGTINDFGITLIYKEDN